MKRTRHTPEQVIRKLREADRMLAEQRGIAEIAKELGVSENTYHRWRNQYGGMKADDVKRLKELERENVRLKRIVANQALDIDGGLTLEWAGLARSQITLGRVNEAANIARAHDKHNTTLTQGRRTEHIAEPLSTLCKIS